ncbi:hypothetical protein BD560DRAFT_484020 [Blakeslea trispora]|nr:hypothetical protein BD560DRAFT_484020 [Blakeslea trispora]
MDTYPELIERGQESLLSWITDDNYTTYNGCHFWSNFEIGSLDFFRSERYLKYFDFLDKQGGFFYERWGDAPVHSLGVAMMLKTSEVHFFNDIGYKHNPLMHCPIEPWLQKNCWCNEKDNFDTPLIAFNLPTALLDQLYPLEQDTEAVLGLSQEEEKEISLEPLKLEDTTSCLTCDVVFEDREEQRQHFKTDWHRYNMKRKVVLKSSPVSLEQFELLLADLTESISGSESEEEDDTIETLVNQQKLAQERQEELTANAKQVMLPVMKKYSALTWFKTDKEDTVHYGIYRHLLEGRSIRELKTPKYWTVLMLGGGHFAGAVVHLGNSQLHLRQINMVAHRTIHRYTTRRKQGGSQSTNDQKGSAAQSAGAQIRRYNEQMLQQEVRQLMSDWREYIQQSEMVCVHAPSGNRKVLFHYEGAVLDQVKVKSIPFATRRPTLDELKRVVLEMVTVKVIQVDPQAIEQYRQAWIDKELKAEDQLAKSTMNKKLNQQEERPPQLDPAWTRLIRLVRQNKANVTLNYLEKQSLDIAGPLPSFLQSEEDLYHYPTLLHMVASQGGKEEGAQLIKALLTNYDADPTLVSGAGKTAYEVCKDKEARNAFRRCMYDLPEKWAWLEKARVPSPLSEQQEKEQLAKERKKQAREQEKKQWMAQESAKQQALQELQEQKEREHEKATKRMGQGRLLSTPSADVANSIHMTPEARMRLEREKRARAAEERMKRFAKST